MIPRSYLFVPGNDPGMLAKAWSRDADALLVDLEDAVPVDGKDGARQTVSEWLEKQSDPRGPIWVRVNNDDAVFERDLAAVAHPGLAGVVVPKVLDASQARRRSDAIAGIRTGSRPGFLPMIETPRAMLEVDAIASAPGVVTMMIGEYDFAAELGITLESGDEMLVHRARLVLACAAAGIGPPVAPVHIDFRDREAFRRSTVALRQMGYVGRAAIHPAQVAVANEVFTPSPTRLAEARRQIEIHEQALAEGRGVSTDDEGRLLDEAILRGARRTIALSRPPGI